jgi:hypothetical protein
MRLFMQAFTKILQVILQTCLNLNDLHDLVRKPVPHSLLEIVWKIPMIKSCIRLNSCSQTEEWLVTTNYCVTFLQGIK